MRRPADALLRYCLLSCRRNTAAGRRDRQSRARFSIPRPRQLAYDAAFAGGRGVGGDRESAQDIVHPVSGGLRRGNGAGSRRDQRSLHLQLIGFDEEEGRQRRGAHDRRQARDDAGAEGHARRRPRRPPALRPPQGQGLHGHRAEIADRRRRRGGHRPHRRRPEAQGRDADRRRPRAGDPQLRRPQGPVQPRGSRHRRHRGMRRRRLRRGADRGRCRPRSSGSTWSASR